ncbi:hypothetical protein D3C76_1118160 [compost metagenome]
MFELETAGATIQFLEGIDRVNDVVAGAIELFLRVFEILANLPHQQFHYRFTLFTHAAEERLHVPNTLDHTQGWPDALATVIGLYRCIQCGHGRLRVQKWGTAQNHGLMTRFLFQAYRTADGSERAVPQPQLAIDQIFALFNGRSWTERSRDFVRAREESFKSVVQRHFSYLCAHCAVPGEKKPGTWCFARSNRIQIAMGSAAGAV